MKKKSVTIRDVARRAGVSHQTVSRVINNTTDVADATRERVQAAMQALDYRPNRAAQMLTTSRSNTLELIMVDMGYGGRMADSTKNMVHTAKLGGYSMLMSETDRAGLPAAFDSVASRLVDGVVLYAPRLRISDSELLALAKGIPFVRRDYVPMSRVSWVGFDQSLATRQAVEHLIELGHTDIAAIPPVEDILNGYWRYSTWKNVILEHDLTPGPAYPGDYSMASGYVAVQEIMKTGRPFTALLAGTDIMALGAYRALRDAGIRIPDDVSVVGFDNTEFANYVEPRLTTIDFRFDKQDELVVRYLIEHIRNPEMELRQHVLMADLVVRDSTTRRVGA